MTRPRFSYEGSGHGPIAFALVAFAVTGAACMRNNTSQADATDAAVTFQSAIVTRPATWQNLWGSWPFNRYYHSMVYDSNRKVMVMYGGQQATNGPYFDDTWEWDGASGVWNEKTPAPNGTMNTSPPVRTQQLMVYDTVQKKAFMFSGWQPQAGFYIPDQWEWDGTTWTERVVAGAQPNPRYGGSMVWDSDRNRAVLFGGFCSNLNTSATARCNDVWEWDGTGAGTWTNRTPAASATQPTPRMYHSAVYDASRKKMVVYTGYTGTGAANTGTWVDETWEWDGSTTPGTWTKVTPAAGKSVPYYTSGIIQLFYDAGRGKVVAYYYQPYMYEYDPVTPQWTQITTTKVDTDQPPYNAEAFAYDSTRAQVVLFGGYSGSTRELWDFDGTTGAWTNRSDPTNGPIQRQYPSVAYDSKRGKVMLFGGYSSIDGLVKQDTWEWSGTDSSWINRTNANPKPPGRQQGAMVYDSKRDQLLLWAGSGTGVTNDLWSWSPTTRNWTTVPVNGTPPTSAANYPMFYDPRRDTLEIYINYYTYYDFDLATSTWTNRYDSKNPAPSAFYNRSYAEVTYDTDRSKMLFVAGYGTQPDGTSAYDADVWEWDAATNVFTERRPPAAGPNPVGRNNHVVSYDSARRVVVMFGGNGTVTGFTGVLDDSWEWDGIAGTWTETTPPGVKPLPRYNHIQIFDSLKATTLVFGGYVPGDTTYGPQEIWEYLANSSPRPNGSGCSVASASGCMSGNCVDGVCCAVPAAQCAGTCMACNVPGKLGTCSAVPVGGKDETCPSDQACDANQQCKKPLGQQCGAFNECASGHCADGVCCNTDCNETCKTCSLATSRGTCSFVPTGNEDPIGAPACISSETQGRSCDGAGTCQNLAKANGKPCTAGGQCTSGFCIDGVCCNSQCAGTCQQCDRTGVVGSCYPVLAGGIDHSATTPCDGAGQSCNGSGTCATGKKPNGSDCSVAGDCTSNYCVDKICCVSACTGTCQSCAVAGSLGACVNLPAGSQDTNSSPTCSSGSYCDAMGSCQTGMTPNGLKCTAASECGSGYCVDGVCCVNACTGACQTCNGDTPGTCGSERIGFADPACPTGQYCDNMQKCAPGKKPNGAVCTSDIECGSTYCIDGTCCESICTGDCRTCANSTGTCQFAADGTDPRAKCKGSGVAICGGKCNGAGACRWAAAGTACSTAGCQSDGFIKAAGTCDGAGNCPATITTDCMGFACITDTATGMAKCLTDCTMDPMCTLKNWCVPAGTADAGAKSMCPARFDIGFACQRNSQCSSGTCSDGVCCDRNCDKCGSCNTPGNVGHCIPIPAGTDPEMECQSNASDPMKKCAGLCNGQAACQYPLAGTACGLCAVCDGSGLCNQLPPSKDDPACGTIECTGLNVNSCRVYSDLSSNRCDTVGACKVKNTAKACTVFTDTCPTDGGMSGTGGSIGGTGSAGNGGGGRGGISGSAGSPAGTGGVTTTGSAGTTGKDGGAGKGGGGGGGGCGCSLGGSESASSLGALLVLASVMIRRRRRR